MLRVVLLVAGLLIAGCTSAELDQQSNAVLLETRAERDRSGERGATTTSIGIGTATTDRPEDDSSDRAPGQTSAAAEPAPADMVQGSQVPTRDRPQWLGLRPLPTTPDGLAAVPQTTPDALRDRRFATVDTLPAPSGDRFTYRAGPIPGDVLARSTWTEGCPVAVVDLTYVRLSFWGFDDRPHTGELIVNAEVAEDIAAVFEKLYDARFPIEEMRVVSLADLDAEPTGDGNNTTSFVCRPVTGGTAFSQHAHGLAIDINPFHNPYLRADLLLPELSASYLDRAEAKPGTVQPGDLIVEAFGDIGWGWGGDWRSLKDYQHFSHNNR